MYLRAIPALARFRGDALGPDVAALDRPADLRGRGPRATAAAPRPGRRRARAGDAGRRAPTRRAGRRSTTWSPRSTRTGATAFVLTQVVGLPYAEAAEVCGVPVGTIRSRVARARADLVDRLGETELDAENG